MIESLGSYKILDRIGDGGIGEVFRARDTRAGRTVAIKVVAPIIADDASRRDELLRDAHRAAALSHPNIAALYEVAEDQGELFLVFEFVPGEPLKAAIAGRPLNARRAIHLAVQIADALAAAHADGIVDGGLTPDRIFVTPKGNAKILGLGLGAWTTSGLARAAAAAGAAPAPIAAIAAYMSPEQVAGGTIDHRSDVFSLGVVLFEMLNGRLPFAAITPATLPMQIVQSPPLTPQTANGTRPAPLEAILSKALAPRVGDRYDSAATMASELRTVGAILDVRSGENESPVGAHAVLAPHRRSFALPVTIAGIAVVVGAALWLQRSTLERAWRRAMRPAPHAVIAVMPLEQVPADPSRTFVADGLTADLVTRLAQTPGLTVVGRSAIRTYRGQSARDIAQRLGAAVLLTGTTHVEDGNVKMALSLADATDGEPLWTGEYTRAGEDVVAMQANAAEDVARALRVPLRLTAATARTSSRRVDRHAYEEYLQGREAAARHQPDDAIKDYQAAVAADDSLPEAFAALARALSAHGSRTAAQAAPRGERIETAAERAYQLDPDLAAANTAMGIASSSLAQTLQYLRRSIEIDPSNGDGYRDVADVIRTIDPVLSAAFDDRARELDPEPWPGRSELTAWHSQTSRRQDRAAAAARDRDIVASALKGVLDKRP